MTISRWPLGVPIQILADGYDPKLPANILRSEMESGAKQRVIATGTPEMLGGRFRFKRDQYLAFKKWVFTDLKSTGQFYWLHPDDGRTVICTFVAQDGRIFAPSRAPAGGRYVAVVIEAREVT